MDSAQHAESSRPFSGRFRSHFALGPGPQRLAQNHTSSCRQPLVFPVGAAGRPRLSCGQEAMRRPVLPNLRHPSKPVSSARYLSTGASRRWVGSAGSGPQIARPTPPVYTCPPLSLATAQTSCPSISWRLSVQTRRARKSCRDVKFFDSCTPTSATKQRSKDSHMPLPSLELCDALVVCTKLPMPPSPSKSWNQRACDMRDAARRISLDG
jgi:hypothetical protein